MKPRPYLGMCLGGMGYRSGMEFDGIAMKSS
jgi:hypothetical protein